MALAKFARMPKPTNLNFHISIFQGASSSCWTPLVIYQLELTSWKKEARPKPPAKVAPPSTFQQHSLPKSPANTNRISDPDQQPFTLRLSRNSSTHCSQPPRLGSQASIDRIIYSATIETRVCGAPVPPRVSDIDWQPLLPWRLWPRGSRPHRLQACYDNIVSLASKE